MFPMSNYNISAMMTEDLSVKLHTCIISSSDQGSVSSVSDMISSAIYFMQLDLCQARRKKVQ